MTIEKSLPREFRRARGRGRDRNRDIPRNPVAYLVAGPLIAIWGFGMLLDNLGLGEMRDYMHRAWPAALVIVGVTLLIHRDASRNRYGFWGTVLLFAGVLIHVSQRDWFHVNFWNVAWPTLLVVLGGSFIYRAFNHPDRQVAVGLSGTE